MYESHKKKHSSITANYAYHLLSKLHKISHNYVIFHNMSLKAILQEALFHCSSNPASYWWLLPLLHIYLFHKANTFVDGLASQVRALVQRGSCRVCRVLVKVVSLHPGWKYTEILETPNIRFKALCLSLAIDAWNTSKENKLTFWIHGLSSYESPVAQL